MVDSKTTGRIDVPSTEPVKPEREPIRPDKAPEPRTIGQLDSPTTEEDRQAQAALIDETLAAGGATVVASNGEKEITAFKPIDVTSDGWRMSFGRRVYDQRVLFKLGEEPVPAPETIAGFGLVNADGEQVAWSPLPEPVVVQPNTTVGIEDSICF